MLKTVFLYEDMLNNKITIVNSMAQVSILSGVNYRTLQRKMNKLTRYYDPSGKFRVEKTEFIKDKREKNRNPNLRSKY